MDIDKVLIRLIDGFHRSVVEPAIWGQTLDALLDVFRSQHAFLFTTKTAGLIAPLLVTAGIDGDDRDRFLTKEADRAWAPINANIVPGVAAGIQEVIRLEDFEHSEFFNEIVKPTKCLYSGFVQEKTADLSFHLTLCRPNGQGLFETDETDLLQRLLPHLTTALNIRQRLHISEQTSAGFEELIQHIEHPAMIVDADCRPLFINGRASQLLASRDGLSLTNGQFHGATTDQTSRLHARVAAASDGSDPHARHMYLARTAPRLPLVLDIIPVWRLGLLAAGLRTPRVAIIVKQPGAPFTADRTALQDILRFTPRESEIAGLLASGATVEAISRRLNLTPGTVRYNLQRIFEKAGVHTQGALVALVHGFGRGSGTDL